MILKDESGVVMDPPRGAASLPLGQNLLGDRWMNKLSAFAVAIAFISPPVASAQTPGDGAELFKHSCSICHSVDRANPSPLGPNLAGVYDRPAGSLSGYAYSSAIKGSGLKWDQATLDRFLEHPMKVVPGTKMGYGGMPDSGQRNAIIAYLKQAK